MLSEGDATRAPLVLCHPHPQYGGSMHDSVLDTISRVAQDRSVTTLRFNFRGVGASDGRFDRGIGEIDDLLAVLSWLRAEYAPDAVLLAGYSFGSNVVWQALDRAGSVAQVLLVAPPITAMRYAARSDLATPLDIIYGDEDTFVATAELEQWAATAAPGARITCIAGADHFFGAAHDALARAVERALAGV